MAETFPSIEIQEFGDVIGEIYAATEDPQHWPRVLNRIARLIEGESAWLSASYIDSTVQDLHVFAGADPAMVQKFTEYYSSINVWAERMDRMFPVGSVGYSHHAICDRELHQTEFYADFLRPNEMGYCMGAIAENPEQPPALLIGIRAPGRGPFNERHGRVFEALLPHVRRALRLHRKVNTLRSCQGGLESALDAFGHAVIGLSDTGTILLATETARLLLDSADGLRIKDGRLVADLAEENSELQFRMREAAAKGTGFSRASSGAILVRRKSGRRALRLTLMPFARTLFPHVTQLRVLVFVDDPSMKPVSRFDMLRMLFKLSPTEARLMELLASGIELATAADRIRITKETARFHLKSIFRKTGVRRQSELIRLMLNLPGTNPNVAFRVAN